MQKNLYKVLDIAVNATAEEVKVAFRRRAMELHPDQSGLESGPFLEIQEAYAILSDPEQRRQYDAETFGGQTQHGVTAPSMGSSGRAEPFRAVGRFGDSAKGFFAEGLFEEFLTRFWNSPKISHPSEPTHPEDLTVQVAISPQKASLGGRMHIRFPIQAACPACRGRGIAGSHVCMHCGGNGSQFGEIPLAFDLPGGVHDYAQIRVPLDPYGIPGRIANIVLRVRGEGWDWR